MSRKKIEQQVELTTEARIVHAPEIKVEIEVKRNARVKGTGLSCACGAQMLVEHTRRPGTSYPHWIRKPYRIWKCPKCGEKVRQRI